MIISFLKINWTGDMALEVKDEDGEILGLEDLEAKGKITKDQNDAYASSSYKLGLHERAAVALACPLKQNTTNFHFHAPQAPRHERQTLVSDPQVDQPGLYPVSAHALHHRAAADLPP